MDSGRARALYQKLATVGLLGFTWGSFAPYQLSRAFNSYKNVERDRFILDRRGPNGVEGVIPNTHSSRLPAGWLLTGVLLKRFVESLRLYAKDRTDCYLQALVSLARASSNAMGEPLTEREAMELAPDLYRSYELADRLLGAGIGAREAVGDQLASQAAPAARSLYATFASLPPGDHAAVEWVQEAHAAELEEAGLLQQADRLMNKALVPQVAVLEGLCIDDWFMIARCSTAGAASLSPGLALARARAVRADRRYAEANLHGSIEKDQFELAEGVVVGAELVASEGWSRRGAVLVSAPLERRVSLSVCSLRAARLACLPPGFSRILAGSHTALFMFRRPLMSLLKEVHAFGALSGPSRLRVQPRAVADDLLLCALAAPLAFTDLCAEVPSQVWALDASPHHGAITVAELEPAVAQQAWLGSDKVGGYTRLDAPITQQLKSLGMDPSTADELYCEDEHIWGGDGAAVYLGDPPREFAMIYDFIEVCGGASKVTRFVAQGGAFCAPVLDLSFSRHFDLGHSRFVDWVLWLISSRRVRVVAVEPPCTTFSMACNRPPLRSRARPRGLNQRHPKCRHGNRLMFMALIILLAADRAGLSGFLEQPRTSRARWLSEWLYLLARRGFAEVWTATCGHRVLGDEDPCIKKEFCFLALRMKDFSDLVHRPCPGGHSHLSVIAPRRLPGQPAPPYLGSVGSAIYSDRLARALATSVLRTIAALASADAEDGLRQGPERLHVNEFLVSATFREVRRWAWRKEGHINLLESAVIRSWLKEFLLTSTPSTSTSTSSTRSSALSLRPTALVDSRVAGLSAAKGRSSSKALSGSLEQMCAIQVGGGLYPGFNYAPSKLNVADDPTRFLAVRPPARDPPSWCRDADFVRWLASLPPMHRLYSKWARLFLASGSLVRGDAAVPDLTRLRLLAEGLQGVDDDGALTGDRI